MARRPFYASHGVEDQDRKLRLHLISAQRHSRESGAERIADDITRSRLVEGERDHILSAVVAPAILWIGCSKRLVRAADSLLQNVFHSGYPASAATGSARRSLTRAPVNVEPVVPVRRTEK